MKTRRLSRVEAKARTRQLLLDEAAQTFAKRGYHAATIEDIAEGAGFSRGAFYANFADKADIFLTILDTQRAADFADVAARVQAADPDGTILDSLYDWFSDVFLDGPFERALSEFRLVALDDPALRKRLAANGRAAREAVAAMIAAYCRQHDVRLNVSPDTFAGMITALVSGYATRLTLDPAASPPREIAQALEALWAGITPR